MRESHKRESGGRRPRVICWSHVPLADIDRIEKYVRENGLGLWARRGDPYVCSLVEIKILEFPPE